MHGPGVLGGRYELRDVLGFGGMAEVRSGWDTRLNRPVAIKLLYPGLSSQAGNGNDKPPKAHGNGNNGNGHGNGKPK